MQIIEELAVDQFGPALREGLKHHGCGRLPEAATCYQRAYEENSADVDALLLLGIVARQVKHFPAAIAFTKLAISHKPRAAHLHLNLALAYQLAQDLEPALTSCRYALEYDPSNERAWCVLAEIEIARGDRAAARAAYEQGMSLSAAKGRAAKRLGNLLCEQQLYEAGLAAYAQGIRQAPRDALLHLSLGAAKYALGDVREAKLAYRKALSLKPNFPEAYLNLGNALYHEGSFQAAVVSYRCAIDLRPNYVKAHCNLGNALSGLSRHQEAVTSYERALKLESGSSAARHNLGNALLHLRDYGRAEECFRALLEPEQNSAEHHNSLGNALLQQRRLAEAEDCYRTALRLKPDYAAAHTNLANALLALGRRTEMERHYRHALELDPTNPGTQYNLALACLREGNFREGWERHEWRWRFSELGLRPRKFAAPQWNGQPLNGETILLHAEQGLGDTLQFIRYLPSVVARGGRVVLEVQPQLLALLQSTPSAAQVIARGERLPSFAYHLPLMSLPLIFDTSIDTIPSIFPYLKMDEEPIDAALRTHPRRAGKMRVGLVWAGNPRFRGDLLRSTTLEALLPLEEVEDVDFFSLQFGPAVEQIAPLQSRFPLTDACSSSKDFAETAAFVATLDLVVSVDTAIAHLAGATGIPVWVILPHLADWRWLEHRQDSPWYPTARLFRQPSPGDWNSVAEQVRDTLSALRRSWQSANDCEKLNSISILEEETTVLAVR
jgi:tetratricopeptide (TPR) repeat protein